LRPVLNSEKWEDEQTRRTTLQSSRGGSSDRFVDSDHLRIVILLLRSGRIFRSLAASLPDRLGISLWRLSPVCLYRPAALLDYDTAVTEQLEFSMVMLMS
jgi:hypothetical protein